MTASSYNKATLIFGLAGAIAGIVAVLKYFDDKKENALKAQVLNLDREIKQLELHKRLAEAKTTA